jgi:hypothetical protein
MKSYVRHELSEGRAIYAGALRAIAANQALTQKAIEQGAKPRAFIIAYFQNNLPPGISASSAARPALKLPLPASQLPKLPGLAPTTLPASQVPRQIR